MELDLDEYDAFDNPSLAKGQIQEEYSVKRETITQIRNHESVRPKVKKHA